MSMAISQAKPLLLLLLISLFALPALGVPFQNCASYVKYPVTVKTVKVSTDPVNHNASLSITAFASNKLPNGATVVVYDLIEMVTQRLSLCKVTTCPVARGRFVLNFSNIFPTPRTIVEPYLVEVQMYNKVVEAELMCIAF